MLVCQNFCFPGSFRRAGSDSRDLAAAALPAISFTAKVLRAGRQLETSPADVWGRWADLPKCSLIRPLAAAR